MADPMTRGKLQELLSDMECGVGPDSGDIMGACDDLIAQEREAARAEVERLRAELAKPEGDEVLDWVAECAEPEHPDWYLDGEKRDCPTCAVETAETEVEHLRSDVAGWRDSYERLSRQVLRRHHAWQSARRGRKQAREQARRLRDLAQQALDDKNAAAAQATNRYAVLHVERDRLAEERDALARADEAGERWARQQIERLESSVATLTEQVERVRNRHYPVCSGACNLADACECEERDLICAEDNDRWPCPTRRDLDGTEAAT